MTRSFRRSPLLAGFLCASLAGCGLSSLFDSDDGSDDGNGGEPPSYLGSYAGGLDVVDLRSGDTWPDRASNLTVEYDELTEDLDLAVAISGLPGGVEEVGWSGCSPGRSTVFCTSLEGSTLYDIELSFTNSTASGRILESERRADGNFEAVWEAEGTLTEQE